MAEIRTVAVIGAGIMGRGIAQVAALSGYRTILEDILPASLRRAGCEIRGYLDQAIGLGRLSKADAAAAFQRLEYTGTVEEAARQADLVIESVPEELESKREIFILLDKICRPHTILVANTRSLSVNEIASVTYRPHKVAGMRFIHPVHAMTRLELVRGQATDDETMAACAALGRRLGMEVVVIEEGPGLPPSAAATT
jgi:3-hydroxybutyryl-CoA dehydrogenase